MGIYDIGTGPAKLLSAMRLKLHPTFVGLARAVFGTSAVLASPTLSDTLHVFPPGAENFRFNLPIHQDYPYLMQSPAQLTLWVIVSNLGVPESFAFSYWAFTRPEYAEPSVFVS